MRAFASFLERRARRWSAWIALALVVLPLAALGEALTITDRENLESAFEFLESSGHVAEAIRLRDMARRGHIRRGEVANTDNADTVRQVITVRSDVFGGLSAPGSLNRFKNSTQLAEVLLHELVHVGQYWPIGVDPASDSNERAAWNTWMQATFNWLTARERALARASGPTRVRLAEEIRLLRADLVSGYAGLRDLAIDGVTLVTPDGVPLTADSALRYLDAVEQQAQAVLRGEALTAADRPTEADLASLRADELRHAQAEYDDIVAALTALTAQVGRTRGALQQASIELDAGRAWFDDYRRLLAALLQLCAAAQGHEAQGLRLIGAALGAEQAVDHHLQFARGVSCRGSADLDVLNAAFAQAVTDAANAERLLIDGAAQSANLQDVYTRMAALHADLHSPASTAQAQREVGPAARKAYFEHFKPTADTVGPLVDALQAQRQSLLALLARRDALLKRLKEDPALRDQPEVLALHQRATAPRYDLLTQARDLPPAEIADRRDALRRLVDEGFRAFQELDRLAGTPAPCGDPAAVAQAAEQARPTVGFARMKLAAIDELRQRCASWLAARSALPPVAVPPPGAPPGVPPPPVQPPPGTVGPVGPATPNVTGGLFVAGPALMSLGQGTVFRAIDAGGRVYPGAVFTTSNETVVRVGTDGRAVANRAGSAIVFARVGDMSASLQVQVVATSAPIGVTPAPTPSAPPARSGPYNPGGTGAPCLDLAQQAQAQCKQIVADCKARNCSPLPGYSGCAVDCPGCGNFGDFVAWCPLHPSYRSLIAGGLSAHVAEVQGCAQRFLADRQAGRRERAAACQGESLKRLNDRFAQWIAQACSARCAQDKRAGAIRVMPHRCECQ